MSEWIADAKRTPLSGVVEALGLTRGRMHSLGPCPACGESKRGNEDRRGPIGLTSDGRAWACHRCEEKGDSIDLVCWAKLGTSTKEVDWKALRQECAEIGLCDYADGRKPSARPVLASRRKPSSVGENAGTGSGFEWADDLAEECVESLWSEEGEAALAYLQIERGFTEDTLRAWDIGFCEAGGRDWITIPLRDEACRVVNIRFRSVGDPDGKKQYRVCRGRPLPLFGAHTLAADSTHPVVVTEGELDVLALWQYGFRDNIVTGTSGAASWKDEWLDLLEFYDDLVLCYDDDQAGEKGAATVAEKMGASRCSRAVFEHNDAAECQKQGVPVERIKRAIDRAKPMIGVSFRLASEYADDIERDIANPEQLVGMPTGSTKLDEQWGGLRPGLIVISGESGHGKTTMGTWLCWEQAKRGVPVTITSFEQRPKGTVQKLLRAQLGGDFLKVSEAERRQAMEELGELPIRIVHHYGHLRADKMVEAIQHSSRRYGSRVFLVDHLGFVIDPDVADERRAIDKAIRQLAELAVQLEISILLICHPGNRHLTQQRRVEIGDLKGASAIRQDASDGLIVKRLKPTKTRPTPATMVYLDKVRSEYGVAGSEVCLAYDPRSCSFHDRWSETPTAMRGQRVIVP
jgi:KaiC/GvpD/RAD55 family RecA-like ATPase/5S rRNA maturation endonuclease (ribonuclease M5)